MKFYNVNYRDRGNTRPEYPCVVLWYDNWDDYGFNTTYGIRYYANEIDFTELGHVKILKLDESDKCHNRTNIPEDFETLGLRYCSLGQSESYYKFIATLGDIGVDLLRGMQDVVYDISIYTRFHELPEFQTSLLRFSEASRALNDAPVLFGRSRRVPQFSFTYTMKSSGEENSILPLDFTEYGGLPHRMIALVGRNGSGKTYTLSSLALAASGMTKVGSFRPERPLFAKVIAVSYNAFDLLKTPDELKEKDGEDKEDLTWSIFSYKYCGLRHNSTLLSTEQLFIKLDESLEKIVEKDREEIAKQGLSRILTERLVEDFFNSQELRNKIYGEMSAGQKIISSILFDVVAFIEEESLIVFDEPENHLHPGLLSSLVTIMFDVLDRFKSYAVVATHSPIVIQQLPARFVLKTKRDGDRTTFHSPISETFGEDLATLTEDLLGLAEPETDYHDVLDSLMTDKSYEQILQLFEGRLPLSARLYLRSCLENE